MLFRGWNGLRYGYKWHGSKRLAQLVWCRNIILSMVHFACYANEKERVSEQIAGAGFKEIHLHLISYEILQWIINEWRECKSDTHWKRVLRWGPELFVSNWTYASNCCLISVLFTRAKCFLPLPFVFVLLLWCFTMCQNKLTANILFHPLEMQDKTKIWQIVMWNIKWEIKIE